MGSRPKDGRRKRAGCIRKEGETVTAEPDLAGPGHPDLANLRQPRRSEDANRQLLAFPGEEGNGGGACLEFDLPA